MASAVSWFMAWALLARMDGVGLPREVRLGFVPSRSGDPAFTVPLICCKPAVPSSSCVIVLLIAWEGKLSTNSSNIE